MTENAVVRVLVWDEKPPHAPKEVYPDSINGAVAQGLNSSGGGRRRKPAEVFMGVFVVSLNVESCQPQNRTDDEQHGNSP